MITDSGTSALAKQFMKDDISITALYLVPSSRGGYVNLLAEGLGFDQASALQDGDCKRGVGGFAL